MRIASWLLVLALLCTPLAARAAAPASSTAAVVPAVMTMNGSDPGQTTRTNGTKSIVVGVGAVLGYALMMNPYGTAVMGAAMGAMLAAEFYETYMPAAAPASAQ